MIEASTAKSFRDQAKKVYGWTPRTYLLDLLTKKECFDYGTLIEKERKEND